MDEARAGSFLETTFKSIDEGITIYDKNHRLVAWNSRFQEFQEGLKVEGVQAGETLFKPGAEPPGSEVAQMPDKNGMRRLSDSSSDSGFLTTEDGTILRVRRFNLPDGGVCQTYLDVTREKQLEAQLSQSSKLEAMGRLAGGMAHDINNILTVIIAAAETLNQERGAEKGGEVQQILDAAERGVETTSQLLAFARQRSFKSEALAVGAGLEQIIRSIRKNLGESIHVEVELEDALWSCRFDQAQLHNTIVNLVNNARDAMASKGRIRIQAGNVELDDGEQERLGLEGRQFVHISVTDNGPGMSKDVLARAFDPFFTTKPFGVGTGLGLSLAQEFASQSEGAIDLQTGRNGTSVSLFLPRVVEAAAGE